MKVLVTGAAGFIGAYVARALARRGDEVIGIDNLNDYYDPALKRARLAFAQDGAEFEFRQLDIADREGVESLLSAHPDIEGVVHLAAQAGVRYSLENPYAYIQSNVMGQLILLEAARKLKNLRQFVYASSSSVYGGNTKLPFSVADRCDSPISIYAATKRMDELMGHTYAHLYGVAQTGLRFFTVYGPWGRPDMAAYIFTRRIFASQPLPVFNHGKMKRDFTYIDDIVDGVVAALDHPPSEQSAPHKVYNLGNHRPEELGRFIDVLEAAAGRPAKRDYRDMQPGDVEATYADIEEARRDLGFAPRISIEEGLPRFVEWYREYHKIS